LGAGPRVTVAVARVAVVGSGIAGLGACHVLQGRVALTLFEAEGRCGGHARTVDLTLHGRTHGVDTGFLVFNPLTYPRLTRLFGELGIATAPAQMSFSVQAHGLEWSGASLAAVFAQRRNLLRPRFWRLLAELLRFNRLATALAERGDEAAQQQTVGEFLDAAGFGKEFREAYFLPMVACIWSCPSAQMLSFPLATLLRFCHQHGLLQVNRRPQWHTVAGGSRRYVQAIVNTLAEVRTATPVHRLRRLSDGQVELHSARGAERFDAVVLAVHAPQALALLEAADALECRVLGALRTHPHPALLHTDSRLLPRRPRAWAAWNHERGSDADEGLAVCLHYLLNRLQPLPWDTPVLVSLNPLREPDERRVHGEFTFAHPVFDAAAIAAQRRLPEIQGAGNVWFCGAWAHNGFHEDGLRSGQEAAAGLLTALGQRHRMPMGVVA
jgi:predicted NAD/FAD-binding protein